MFDLYSTSLFVFILIAGMGFITLSGLFILLMDITYDILHGNDTHDQ